MNQCVNCGRDLSTANRADNPGAYVQIKYCSIACARSVKNHRYYTRHKETIIARILRTRREKRIKR